VYLLSFTDFIFRQYIVIRNKCTSVPLTDAHLQRTHSEIVHAQPQSCDHNLNNARIDTVFFFSEMEPLSYHGGYLNVSMWFMKNVLLEQKMIKSQNKCHFVENKNDIIQHDLKLQ